ncbi:hypothetical protein DENSPDRAFT_845111 [Dentipellis sp. KUC8613]|nr:hypothetical protein DENSPDRAFT_845111 [Dentipellis sp. KUC8613]
MLFAEVHWPHKTKADEIEGLRFFPQSLWRHFRHFRLSWPHEWLDNQPPKWGEYGADTSFSGSYYIPRDMNRLTQAIPAMQITKFTISCPFIPPPSLVKAIMKSETLTALACEETPLDLDLPGLVIPTLSSLKLVAVGEALRVGDGKIDLQVSDIQYWICGWKRRYRARRELRLPLEAITASGLLRRHAAHIRTIQLSGDLCQLQRLATCEWAALETFILTGHVPERDGVPLSDVLARMPCVRDVRLLLGKTSHRLLQILPRGCGAQNGNGAQKPSSSTLPALPPTLTRLAVSTTCELTGLLPHARGLDDLAIVSIIDFPRLPIALTLGDATELVHDIARSGAPLRRLRLMVEDKITPVFVYSIARRLPGLEELEIEVCGYHDGKVTFELAEFAMALEPLTKLRALRIGIQFPEFDDTEGDGPWLVLRRQCAEFFARHLPSLRRIGFEFRERTGTHKYQDSWLEFRVERKNVDGGAAAAGGPPDLILAPLPRSWYVFPDV